MLKGDLETGRISGMWVGVDGRPEGVGCVVLRSVSLISKGPLSRAGESNCVLNLVGMGAGFCTRGGGGGGDIRISDRGYSLANLPCFFDGAKKNWLRPVSHSSSILISPHAWEPKIVEVM